MCHPCLAGVLLLLVLVPYEPPPSRCGESSEGLPWLPGSTSPLGTFLFSLYFYFLIFFFELCSLQCENHSMTEAWEVFVCFSFILLKKKFPKHLIVVTSFP